MWIFRSRPEPSPPSSGCPRRRATHPLATSSSRRRGASKIGPGRNGPMILDENGQLVWFDSLRDQGKSATDFKMQSYQGRPVLTWWEAPVLRGPSPGEYVILDDLFREITRVQAGNGHKAGMRFSSPLVGTGPRRWLPGRCTPLRAVVGYGLSDRSPGRLRNRYHGAHHGTVGRRSGQGQAGCSV